VLETTLAKQQQSNQQDLSTMMEQVYNTVARRLSIRSDGTLSS
jgi:hypothetical protein